MKGIDSKMRHLRPRRAAFGALLCSTVLLLLAPAAQSTTIQWYASNANGEYGATFNNWSVGQPWYLTSHGAVGGAPKPAPAAWWDGYPGPHPWDYGQNSSYCTTYKHAQYPGGQSESPLTTAEPNNLSAYTGYNPGSNPSPYQSSGTGAGSTACQAKSESDGLHWGNWLSTFAGSYCGPQNYAHCGVRHDILFGGSSVRPWAYPNAQVYFSFNKTVQSWYAPNTNGGFVYLAPYLVDTTSNCRVELQVNLWKSYTLGGESVQFQLDPALPSGLLVTMGAPLKANTYFTQNYGQSTITNSSTGSWNFGFFMDRINISRIASAANNALAYTGQPCNTNIPGSTFSSNADNWRLLGVEDGQEMNTNGGAAYLGASTRWMGISTLY